MCKSNDSSWSKLETNVISQKERKRKKKERILLYVQKNDSTWHARKCIVVIVEEQIRTKDRAIRQSAALFFPLSGYK